jgi:hypothetical protein
MATAKCEQGITIHEKEPTMTENHFADSPINPKERWHKPEDLTCYNCNEQIRTSCPFVDDWYNTDGDCLALK